MQRNIKIILRIVTTVLVCAAVLFALSISATRLFGFKVYGVLTGSMEPVYPTGSLIYVRDVNTNKLDVGDVITFRISQNVIATHRIVELVPDENDSNIVRYRTKGDANDAVDASLVNKYDIIGKVVFCIPKMGYFMNFIQSAKGIATIVGVSLLLIPLVLVSEIYTASDSTKKRWKGAILKHVGGQPSQETAHRRMEDAHRGRPAAQPRMRYEDAPRRRYDDEYYARAERRRYEDAPRRRYEGEYPARAERRRYEDVPRRRYEEDYPLRSERRRYEDAPHRRYEDEYPTRAERRRYEGEYPSRSERRRESEYRSGYSSRYQYPDD